MNAEAVLEAVKGYLMTYMKETKGFPNTYERGEQDVARKILNTIRTLERKEDENM